MVRAVADPVAAGIAGGVVAGLESAAVRVGVDPVGDAVSGGLGLAAGGGHRIAVANVAADESGRRRLYVLRGRGGSPPVS